MASGERKKLKREAQKWARKKAMREGRANSQTRIRKLTKRAIRRAG